MSLRRIWLVARLDLAHNPRRFFFWFWLAIIGFMTWGLSSGNARMQSGDATVGGTAGWPGCNRSCDGYTRVAADVLGEYGRTAL